MIRIAINGFGRIGRLVTRALFERPDYGDIALVSVNDLGDPASAALLLHRDSVHGTSSLSIDSDAQGLLVNGRSIRFRTVADPADLPHAEDRIDIVLECTGRFAARAQAARHIAAGAGRVLISAPLAEADFTLVCGVNDEALRPDHRLISNASCTTNCLAPLLQTIAGAVGIERARMTTVHPYTNDQPLLDSAHKDPRRARAAALSIIPTTTGAIRAVEQVLPGFAGRFSGASIRVPTADVGLVDLLFVPSRGTNVEEVNALLRTAAGTRRLANILTVEDAPLVSADVRGNPASAVVDASETAVIDGRLARVLAWYDNEWAFANRMVDAVKVIAEAIPGPRRPALGISSLLHPALGRNATAPHPDQPSHRGPASARKG